MDGIMLAIETGEWPDPDGPSDYEMLLAEEMGYDLSTLDERQHGEEFGDLDDF